MENNKKNEGAGSGKLHIFINGIKFNEEQGVKPTMYGRELAALVDVPVEIAEITKKNSEDLIGADESVDCKNGDHFEVIRKTVVAGF